MLASFTHGLFAALALHWSCLDSAELKFSFCLGRSLALSAWSWVIMLMGFVGHCNAHEQGASSRMPGIE